MTQMPATYTQQPSCWTPAAGAVVPERRTGVAWTGDFISILLFKNGRRLMEPARLTPIIRSVLFEAPNSVRRHNKTLPSGAFHARMWPTLTGITSLTSMVNLY